MKRVTIFLVVIVIFVLTTFLCANLILNGDVVLKNFDITKVTNEASEYTIEYEKVPAAVNYKISILDNNNVLIFEKETKKTSEKINLSNLNYGINYSLMVYAYNKAGEVRPANKPYLFTYLEPSFSDSNSLLLANKDYFLNMDGNLTNKEYRIKVLKNNEEVKNEKIEENVYKLDKELYINEEAKISVQIICNKKVVDSIDLFNNMNPVGDVFITSPINEQTVHFNDLTLSYDGGENATSYTIKLYNSRNRVVKTTSTTKKSVVLSKNLFGASESYFVEVIANYAEFSKSDKIKFSVLDKEQVTAVYMNVNNKSMKKDTLVELGCATEDATIYYTLNGDDPNQNGILYTAPFTVKENTTIKAKAAKEDLYNSEISEFNVTINDKKELRVFISPSNQLANIGVSSVGYTNERDEMNDVANYVVERLEEYGVKVYRNNPATNIYTWLKDSNYYGVDVHVAIHSNASVKHNAYGVETWVDNEHSEAFSLAHIVQNNLYSIYPYKDKVSSNRGVRYANGALAEVNTNYLKNGLLIEIAHHDYLDDAKWIMENKKEIGYNIADSILSYYQIKK